jgi:PIN domain nuclease of toxin-antitoxin system
VNLLLDTHVLLWWHDDSERLQPPVRKLIAHADAVHVSAASAWELAIKQALGRLKLRDSIATLIERGGFDELPITVAHTEQVAALPHHHADPFDRMLVAQAQLEGLTLVTHDRQLQAYQVTIAWT